jgi:heme-degrading monooxygenase HmoA
MIAYNIVRNRVKPGHEQDFEQAIRNLDRDYAGLRRFTAIKTGDRAYCMIGEWDSMDAIRGGKRQPPKRSLSTFSRTLDLSDSPFVAAALESRCEKVLQDLLGQIGTDHPRSDAEDVGIVESANHLGNVRVVANRRAHTRMAVCSHRHPETAAAHQQPETLPLGYGFGDLVCRIRIVAGLGGVCTEVGDLEPQVASDIHELLLQLDSRMVGTDDERLCHVPCVAQRSSGRNVPPSPVWQDALHG